MPQIVHIPFGQEHPYEQLPLERFPRQPLSGEPFKVGVVTRPPGSVDGVRVHSTLDGVPQPVIEAQHMVDWQPELEEGVGAEFLERQVKIDQDVWQAPLTAPPAGRELVYWFQTDEMKTEPFSITGECWQSSDQCSYVDDMLTVSATAVGTCELPEQLPALENVEWLTNGQRSRRVRLTFRAAPDERFYGLGERFNALNQRGNVLDVRCYEQYKNQGKRTYMPIPFLLSSMGYGVLVESSRWMQFDLAAAHNDRWILEADVGEDETLDLRWFSGDDPFEIIGEYAQHTGPVVLPPAWSFGLWMSGNEWNSQARVMKEVQASLEHGIQPGVIVIEAWSDETTFYIWNNAEYEPKPGADNFRYEDFTFPEDGKWHDPKGMVDWLHQQGIKVLLWQIPVLKDADETHPQHTADRAHFEQSDFGVREADGTPHRVRPFWFRGGYIWDMTNLRERDWWLNKRAYLLEDVGIDGFKTDGGEHLWGTDVRFADGRRGDEVWDAYPQLYSEAYYTFANQKREAITFSRAGYTVSQRAPLHWAGDEHSTWDAYRHSILAGLSAGISGISFWGWDLGGFSGAIPTAELYLRATAMATFCPVMQYHSEFNQHRKPNVDRTPWNIQERTGDERVISVFRHFVNVRHQLMDYIWQEAQYSATTGQPMMRALQLIDSSASPYQYLFGRSMLVAPVTEPGIETQSVYLPEGRWRSLWSDETFEGHQAIDVRVPIDQIPVFVRPAANLALEGDN